MTHVEDRIDPVADLEIIHTELRLKDVEHCRKYVEGNAKNVERGVGGKEKKYEFETMKKILEILESGKDVRSVAANFEAAEVEIINRMQFLTAKPMVYLANVSSKSYIHKGNKYLEKVAEFVKNQGNNDLLIPFSVTFEEQLLDAEINGGEAGKKEFLSKHPGLRSMLPKIIKSGYQVLDLINFFTAGPDEVG